MHVTMTLMAPVTIAFLGDIVGRPGRQVVKHYLPALKKEHEPDLILANAENSRQGSGLSAEQFVKLRGMGIDGCTLGDHWHRDQTITPLLESATEPVIRPANISAKAPGKSLMRLMPDETRSKSVFVLTVLGRIFFSLPADDPFAAVDRVLSTLPESNPIVIVEAHMEATSEKIALAHYLDGRVTAVVGSHTHVPTADARVLPGGTAFITDMGMCGPWQTVIGRDRDAVVRHMSTGMHTRFGVGSGDERLSGAVIRYDEASARALSIEQVQYGEQVVRRPC